MLYFELFRWLLVPNQVKRHEEYNDYHQPIIKRMIYKILDRKRHLSYLRQMDQSLYEHHLVQFHVHYTYVSKIQIQLHIYETVYSIPWLPHWPICNEIISLGILILKTSLNWLFLKTEFANAKRNYEFVTWNNQYFFVIFIKVWNIVMKYHENFNKNENGK